MLPPDEFVKQVVEARNESELCYHFMNLGNKRGTNRSAPASSTDLMQSGNRWPRCHSLTKGCEFLHQTASVCVNHSSFILWMWIENRYFGIKLLPSASINQCVSGSSFGYQDITSSTLKIHLHQRAEDSLQPLIPLCVLSLSTHRAAAQAGL